MKVTRMWTQNAEAPMSAWDEKTEGSTEPVLVVADTKANAVLLDAAPRMAEELERTKGLVVIYERARTRHLRLIEGGDKEVEEMAEEIERLEWRATNVLEVRITALEEGLSRVIVERDRWHTERDAVVVQRDELREVARSFLKRRHSPASYDAAMA
ncbi:hypothetical protein LCGC14_2423630, partial [marine sediment metagenome]